MDNVRNVVIVGSGCAGHTAALYTGRDNVLGASAGLKHFGKRRLGRSGLDRTYPVPDNVWDIDCSSILNPAVGGIDIHSEYFAPTGQIGAHVSLRQQTARP